MSRNQNPEQVALEKGLPAKVEAEQFVLGSILLSDEIYPQVAAALNPNDFVLEKHRRIFARMGDLAERGAPIEYMTLVGELEKHGQLESVDGISYIAGLTDGLPRFENIDAYVGLVKDAALRRRLILTLHSQAQAAIDGEQTADELLAETESAVMAVGDSRSHTGLETPRHAIETAPGGVTGFLDPSRRVDGLSTPWVKFDEMTRGLHGGELVIVAARPGMGKTALALNLAYYVATTAPDKPAKPVAFFSLEMSTDQLLARMVCAAGRVDQHRFRGGFTNAEERRQLAGATQMVVDSRLWLDDTANTSVLDISAKCRRLRAEHGLALVVVDYLQLMAAAPGSTRRSDSRQNEVAAISRSLKLLAKDLEVPVVALSQLSRGCESRPGDKRPMLSDLRDSGSIEADADLVAMLFREEVYKPDREDLHGMAELIIAKQRNGPVGKIKLAFLHRYTKFESLAEDIGGWAEPDDERLPYADDDPPAEVPF